MLGLGWYRPLLDCSEREGHTFKNNFTTHGASYFEVVLHCLPLTFLADTILSNTNDALMALGEPKVVWGEFLHFLGILALMATVSGFKNNDFWSVDKSFDQHENHCPSTHKCLKEDLIQSCKSVF